MSADDFAAALAIIFGFAGLLCLLDWLLDRADDNEQAERTAPYDLAAVHADDRLLDRAAAREPVRLDDEPVTQRLKAWRDEIDDTLDDRLGQWRTALGMGDRS
jgi:hypothetical protein